MAGPSLWRQVLNFVNVKSIGTRAPMDSNDKKTEQAGLCSTSYPMLELFTDSLPQKGGVTFSIACSEVSIVKLNGSIDSQKGQCINVLCTCFQSSQCNSAENKNHVKISRKPRYIVHFNIRKALRVVCQNLNELQRKTHNSRKYYES